MLTAAAVCRQPPLVAELREYLEAKAATIVEPTCVSHGDFRLGNFILPPTEPREPLVHPFSAAVLRCS